MIYKNGELWQGWKDELKKIIAVKGKEMPKLKTTPEFYLTDLFKHYKEVSPGKVVPMYCPVMFIQPAYEWQDEDGSTSEIRYVEREQIAATRSNNSKTPTVGKFQPEVIEFIDGFLRPDKNKLDFFWFLMNHPDNIMNPVYDNKQRKAEHAKPFIFQYKDKEKEINMAYDKEKQLSEAIVKANNGLTKEEARQLYMNLNNSADVNASERSIGLFLMSYARNNPAEFLKAAANDDSKFGAIVKEAVAFRVLKYLPPVRAWKFVEGEGDPFCTVTKGVNEVDAMVEFLRLKDSDGATLKEIQSRLAAARDKADKED